MSVVKQVTSVEKQVTAATSAKGTTGTLPYAGFTAMAIALLCAVALCWPMLFTTAPLGYFDTASYHSDGATIIEKMQRFVSWPVAEGRVPSAGTIAGPDGQGDGVVSSIRSAPYAVFLYLTSGSSMGIVLAVMLQTAMTLYLLMTFVSRPLVFAPIPFVMGFAVLGLATTLPWFASYAMPDIMVAAMVIYFAVLLRSIDFADGWQVLAIGGIGAFAALSHYANPPLALALCCGVLGWRAVRRTLTLRVIVMCTIPVLLAIPVNLAANLATQSGTSIAPKRLPLILARSLEDGPAQWYLTEACPTQGYAICELFDEIPDNIGDFLWSPDGIKSATDAQFERIRAEEVEILIETMKAYPLAQTRALLGNAGLQLVSIGTDQIMPRHSGRDGVFPTSSEVTQSYGIIGIFDTVVKISTALGIGLLMVLAATRRLPGHIAQAFALVLFATMVNGVLFGGFSAPVDRYQSRIAWLFPALLVLTWIELSGRTCGQRACAGPGQP